MLTEAYGINQGDWVGIKAVSVVVLRATVTDRVKPGGIYHLSSPVSGANVITTDNSDWATNCRV